MGTTIYPSINELFWAVKTLVDAGIICKVVILLLKKSADDGNKNYKLRIINTVMFGVFSMCLWDIRKGILMYFL